MDFYLEAGVTGITIFGVLGEASRPTPADPKGFLDHVPKRMDGRNPVVVQGLDELLARLERRLAAARG